MNKTQNTVFVVYLFATADAINLLYEISRLSVNVLVGQRNDASLSLLSLSYGCWISGDDFDGVVTESPTLKGCLQPQ